MMCSLVMSGCPYVSRILVVFERTLGGIDRADAFLFRDNYSFKKMV
jgi:hypothetical protein